MSERDLLSEFVGELGRLRQLAGSPSLNRLAGLATAAGRSLPRSTISDKLTAKSLPDWDFVAAFVAVCAMHAEASGVPLPAEAVDLVRWEADYWRLIQAIDAVRPGERLVASARAEMGRRGVSGPARSGEERTVPRQLPAPPRPFVGRRAELTALTATVVAAGREDTTGIAMIHGPGGVGKTALALRWGHQVARRFAHGQLYANLRGFGPAGDALGPAEVIRAFLEALGVPAGQIPASLEARAALYRTLVAGRRMLVLLDNARAADQVRPLLPGSAGCFVVVTSRARLTGLVAAEGATPLGLDVFSRDEARELLRRRLGGARPDAEPAAVEQIIRSCGRLPLALTVIAARALTQPGSSLGGLADQLRDARSGLDAFDTDGDASTDVRSVFSFSYRSLTDPAARLFRLLGLHPGPEIAVPAAASLAGVPADRARYLLAELAAAHLVAEPRPGRVALHDLLRAYAAEAAGRDDPPAERRAAVRRVLDHYLGSAHAADDLLGTHWTPIDLEPAAAGVVPEAFPDAAGALAWFTEEREVLLAVLRLGAAAGLDRHVWRLAWTLTDFLDRHGDWAEWAETQRIGLAAAVRLGDPIAEAHASRGLAGACARVGRHAEARAHLGRALTLFERLGDRLSLALSHLNLGWVCEEEGGHAEALDHVRIALDLLQAAGHREGEAGARNALGWLHVQLGQADEALAAAGRALAMYHELGDPHGAANALDTMGFAHHHLGQYAEAVACYERALEPRRATGGRYYEANVLSHLGDAYEAMGDGPLARRSWGQALEILEEIGHPDAEKLRKRIPSSRP